VAKLHFGRDEVRKPRAVAQRYNVLRTVTRNLGTKIRDRIEAEMEGFVEADDVEFGQALGTKARSLGDVLLFEEVENLGPQKDIRLQMIETGTIRRIVKWVEEALLREFENGVKKYEDNVTLTSCLRNRFTVIECLRAPFPLRRLGVSAMRELHSRGIAHRPAARAGDHCVHNDARRT
jgi:hypothetical protein